MRLAKPQLDIGLSTNAIGPCLAFWQGEVGARFDHVLPIRRGQVQHRHDLEGTVLKLNAHDEPLPEAPAAGYRELIIARDDLDAQIALRDPDGAAVRLVPRGFEGIEQIGVRLAARDLEAHRRFHGRTLGLPELSPGVFAVGKSRILLESDPSAEADSQIRGRGWRYVTFQVFGVDEAYAAALAGGAQGAMAPTTLGTTARIAMIRDPDGNWIELSQRASIVGTLDPAGAR